MTETTKAAQPALKLKFLSHGTLESKNLEESRKFYEDFLGCEVVRTSDISMMVRLGGKHIYAVVENKKSDHEMPFLYHNGLDVSTEAEVDECHRVCEEQAGRWGLTKISKPAVQHGTYSFYFWDRDGNAWEILSNPEGGYTWLFEKGEQTGRNFLRTKYERTDDSESR